MKILIPIVYLECIDIPKEEKKNQVYARISIIQSYSTITHLCYQTPIIPSKIHSAWKHNWV